MLALDLMQALVFGFPEVKPAHFAESPIAAVPLTDWKRFAKSFINAENDVTDSFRYGIFEMSVRRLCDLGLMVKPHTTATRSGKLVWLATWEAPWTLKTFLADHSAQYQTFCTSMVDYSHAEGVRDLVGRAVDTRIATLSGLLAVAHRAGLQGLGTWFANGAEREAFSHTTALFQLVNGIF